MTLLPAFANLAWLTTSAPDHWRFARALANPAEAQDRWLRRHLRRNADTAYGRAHRCGTIGNYREFARRVPIVDYDALAPWIDRIRGGDSQVLTVDPVRRLVPTSGSTSARKLIPFTSTLQREFNAAIAPWLGNLTAQFPTLPLGSAYWSVTPPGSAENREESAVPIGFDDDTEYLGGFRARLVAATMAVPSSVRHLDDVAGFRRTVLVHLLRRSDLRFISIWHPSFLLLLLDTLAREWSSLKAEAAGQTDESRRRELDAADPHLPHTLWPRLRVVSCWADGHAAGPAADLQQRLPGVAIQPKGLLATEACVTLPYAGVHPLAVCSHFFEFIDDEGNTHPVEGVRGGQTYEIVVTTGGGLWRYRLGDRVEVSGFLARTPVLRFLGRAGNISDLCGEKLSETFVIEVLGALCPRARFALLAPERGATGWRYVLFMDIESDRGPDAVRLDAALAENPQYAVCRRLGQLEPPRVVRVGGDAFARFAAAEAARGRRLGDLKPVALSTRTEWTATFPAPMDAATSAAGSSNPQLSPSDKLR